MNGSRKTAQANFPSRQMSRSEARDGEVWCLVSWSGEKTSQEFVSKPSEMQTCPQPAAAGKGGGSVYLPLPRPLGRLIMHLRSIYTATRTWLYCNYAN